MPAAVQENGQEFLNYPKIVLFGDVIAADLSDWFERNSMRRKSLKAALFIPHPLFALFDLVPLKKIEVKFHLWKRRIGSLLR